MISDGKKRCCSCPISRFAWQCRLQYDADSDGMLTEREWRAYLKVNKSTSCVRAIEETNCNTSGSVYEYMNGFQMLQYPLNMYEVISEETAERLPHSRNSPGKLCIFSYMSTLMRNTTNGAMRGPPHASHSASFASPRCYSAVVSLSYPALVVVPTSKQGRRGSGQRFLENNQRQCSEAFASMNKAMKV